jgi:hypothetical protein
VSWGGGGASRGGGGVSWGGGGASRGYGGGEDEARGASGRRKMEGVGRRSGWRWLGIGDGQA